MSEQLELRFDAPKPVIADDLRWYPDWDYWDCWRCGKRATFDPGSAPRMHRCTGGKMRKYTDKIFTGTDKEFYASRRGRP